MEAEQFNTLVKLIANLSGQIGDVRQDLVNFRKEVATEFTKVRAEMAAEFKAVRSEMAGEFANVRQEMATEFANVREEMASEFEAVRVEMAIEAKNVRQEMNKGFKKQVVISKQVQQSFNDPFVELEADFKTTKKNHQRRLGILERSVGAG